MDNTPRNLTRRSFLQTAGAAALSASLATESKSLASETQSTALKSDKKIRMGIVGGGFGASFQWHLDP
ncbi:MAG: twin-arginine translocation signal domain-containing protein, partial [Pirellulales bacterium]|nr:twin-arginine translocation signal domain-containing protein [Pirellulales bacterium]